MDGYQGIKIPTELQSKFDDGTYTLRQGKVRDVITSDEHVILIATDRVSAFDVVMPTLIPGRGKILTQMSDFWFDFFADVPNHLMSFKDPIFMDIRSNCGTDFVGRTQVCHKVDVLPVEFVVRGYMAGSLWKDYNLAEQIGGKCLNYLYDLGVPRFIRQCEKLPNPILTPSTKAPIGQHDTPLDFADATAVCADHLGWPGDSTFSLMSTLREVACYIYSKAHRYAMMKGIIIADTKFEFGIKDGQIFLIDEILTPDSSRFWSLKDYSVGRDQDSFDKQILRNYLQELVDKGEWNKTSPGPELPDEIVQRIINRYKELARRLIS